MTLIEYGHGTIYPCLTGGGDSLGSPERSHPHRYFLMKRRINRPVVISAVLMLFLFLSLVPFYPSLSVNLRQSGAASSINWSNLRGAVYRWQQLTPAADQANSANPATEMAIFKSLGFNYARIDDIDWKAIQSNQSGEMALLTQVANACDANGIYCVDIGGVTSTLNRIPSNIGGGAYGYTSQGFTNFLTDFFQNKNTAISGIPVYNGWTVWEALFQQEWKPLIQTLNSHPSTIGYELDNEPNNGVGSVANLHNYYEYMTQRIRTLTTKAVVFQVYWRRQRKHTNSSSHGGLETLCF